MKKKVPDTSSQRIKRQPLRLSFAAAADPLRQAIREGNVVEAIRLSVRTGAQESPGLLKKFVEAEQRRTSEQTGLEEWCSEQLRICSLMLELDWMNRSGALKTPDAIDKAYLLEMLHRHQTEQALALCTDFGNEYLLLQTHLNLARTQSGRGLMESEYWEATRSKINVDLQELLEQVPDAAPPARGWLMKIRKFFNRVYHRSPDRC